MAEDTSRLLNGTIDYHGQDIPIDEYRDMIFARSLYSVGNEYENTNKFSLNNKSNVASSISTILTVIPQYNRLQVNTNLLSNVLDNSPIAKIGLIMLGKHMAYNSAMNLSIKYIPTIDLSQALKGNPKDIFKFNQDNTITVKNKDDRTFLDKVGSVASNILGIDTYGMIGDANPFSKNPNRIDYIENTGGAQLSRFFNAIKYNTYKPLNDIIDPSYTTVLTEKMNDVGPKLLSSSNTLFGNQTYMFNFDNNKVHPYFRRQLSFSSSIANIIASENMILSYTITGDTNNVQEYAPTYQYIKDNFGDTVKRYPENNILDVVKQQDSNEEQIVWGRDGVADEANAFLKDLRGDDDSVENNPDSKIFDNNNIRKGILEYTRNLLNASEGNFVDITRKAFKDGQNYVGFNGSPLWKSNNSKYSVDSRTDNKTGIRQHTILDQYDGYHKSIRFKGNIGYNGNENSVIYKNVVPRMHPLKKDDGIDSKNLMFSFENLAIGTVKREKYGVIDDEYGTPIPLSEVGDFGGRKLWFPPYNLQLNEVAAAKYESTVMVGRNEPMYNYQNSERSAVLSFSLLVDYPEQLRNLQNDSPNNKDIADFFAFGGDPLPLESTIEKIEEKIEKLNDKLNDDAPEEQAEPPNKPTKRVSIYFQNDTPVAGEESTIIQTMYDDSYEIIVGCLSSDDGNGFGYNNKIYYVDGLSDIPDSTDNNNKYELTGSAYQTGDGIDGQHGSTNELTQNLKTFYDDEDTRKYYDIEIYGYASKLWLADEKDEETYNKKVSERRIDASIALVWARLNSLYGGPVADEIVNNNIKTFPIGSRGASSTGADPKYMHMPEVKEERRSTLKFKRNTVPVDKKEQIKTQEDRDREDEIKKEIEVLEFELKVAKNNIKENVYKERKNAILNSFESVTKNQFYPIFHSQTPEDFHRRLTFLQQCTRQGAAKRYDVVDSGGGLRARNSVFGKQPICIMRIGDFFNTKVIIESVTIDYNDTTWDLNPEGFGLQPMIANITLQMKIIGGQSLKGPIDALQNAVSFNYYANSTFTDRGMYARPSEEANIQNQYINGVVGKKSDKLNSAYDNFIKSKVREGDK